MDPWDSASTLVSWTKLWSGRDTYRGWVTCYLCAKKAFRVIAFWQVPLSEENASLTTFSTPFGRYFFQRFPFGLCSASEVLQKRVYQTFSGIDDVQVIANETIIASTSEEEADYTLIKLFKRTQEKNVKFNIAKSQLLWIGNIISPNGVKPDPSNIEAIINMREPQCKKDVQHLIGVLNYLSQYIPDMSTVTAPMIYLLKADASEHESDDIEVSTNMRIHRLATKLPMSNQQNEKV